MWFPVAPTSTRHSPLLGLRSTERRSPPQSPQLLRALRLLRGWLLSDPSRRTLGRLLLSRRRRRDRDPLVPRWSRLPVRCPRDPPHRLSSSPYLWQSLACSPHLARSRHLAPSSLLDTCPDCSLPLCPTAKTTQVISTRTSDTKTCPKKP